MKKEKEVLKLTTMDIDILTSDILRNTKNYIATNDHVFKTLVKSSLVESLKKMDKLQ